MEAHPNEYVAQLLDRAANLITDGRDGGIESWGDQASEWLQEYHAEKARFGQPLGSPAYSDAVQAARGEDVPVQQREARRAAGTDTADGGSEGGDQLDYDTATLTELQDAARRRGLPSSGTKADIRERLEDDDRDANAEG
jgi:hypothetical protein